MNDDLKLVTTERLRFSANPDDWDAAAKIEQLTEALRFGIGAALNELTAHNIPLEWSPNSGIGRMLAALGVDATTMTDEVRAALE